MNVRAVSNLMEHEVQVYWYNTIQNISLKSIMYSEVLLTTQKATEQTKHRDILPVALQLKWLYNLLKKTIHQKKFVVKDEISKINKNAIQQDKNHVQQQILGITLMLVISETKMDITTCNKQGKVNSYKAL